MFYLDTIPEFVENTQYRQLTPLTEGGRDWRFGSKQDMKLEITGLIINDRVFGFYDRHGKLWMKIDRTGIWVAQNYWWNGCTPKFYTRLFGWCGTPDFHCTRLAAFFHDPLYQFHGTKHFPFSKETCDKIFRRIIELSGHPKTAAIYYAGVRAGGRWCGHPMNGETSAIIQ